MRTGRLSRSWISHRKILIQHKVATCLRLACSEGESEENKSDPVKGGALMVFRRVFSSTMRPEDGFVIDKEGQAPDVYAERHPASEFEKETWTRAQTAHKRFWDLANDEKLAKERGVRANPRRRALHASGARPGLRNLPEVNRRSHRHARNAHGAAANESVEPAHLGRIGVFKQTVAAPFRARRVSRCLQSRDR
jgi:hypothetical protein